MRLGVSWASLAIVVAAFAACTGSAGPAGPKGDPGAKGDPGTGTPSVSAVTPTSAFLGRTLDLTVSGSGTAWSDATTVQFSEPKIKVNKVTAASASGLVVNVTIAPDAAPGATDVTVSDGSNSEAYKGAFQIKAPLEVTVDQPSGVPQGGHRVDPRAPARHRDTVRRGRRHRAELEPRRRPRRPAGDRLRRRLHGAGRRARRGRRRRPHRATSGGVDSIANKAFKIAARAPKVLTGPTSGNLSSATGTGLYQFTPGDTSTRFVQVGLSSADGGAPVRRRRPQERQDRRPDRGLRQHVRDGHHRHRSVLRGGAGLGQPVRASAAVRLRSRLPRRQGDPRHRARRDRRQQRRRHRRHPVRRHRAPRAGERRRSATAASPPTPTRDYYQFTVSGASAGSPKTVHVATGGDALTDSVIQVVDGTDADAGDSMGPSSDIDYQEDMVVHISQDGTYYVKVSASGAGYFDPTHNTYQLFIDVQ